jgi:hypothetical protein
MTEAFFINDLQHPDFIEPPNEHVNVVICTPGDIVNIPYLLSLLNTIRYFESAGITWCYRTAFSPHVNIAREHILNGGFGGNGGYKMNPTEEYKKQWRAFNNDFTYDQMLWIDNDISWDVDQVIKILEYPEDIVSGVYVAADMETAIVALAPHKRITIQQIKNLKPKLYEAFTTGMGFMKVRSGVVESMPRPWFYCYEWDWISPSGEYLAGLTIEEDTSFCHRARQAGYKVYVDPTMLLGHWKKVMVDPWRL